MSAPHPPALLSAALDYAARGWHVFPLQRPDTKKPPVADWENRATTDPARIRRCWSAGPYNVGIACGPAGLLVIDLDTPKPGERPPAPWDGEPGISDGADVFAALCERAGQPFPTDTYTVATPSGGRHLYFTSPPDLAPMLRNTTGRHRTGLGWLIDTRGGGGYVLAPPSTVAGRPYRVVTDVPPAPLPEWLSGLLSARRAAPLPGVHPQPAGCVSDASAYVRAALQGEGQRVRAAAPGGRNHALNKAAYNLGRLVGAGVLPEGVAYTALSDAATTHFGTGPDAMTPGEAHGTIRSGLAAGIRNPRRLPRKAA
ncbi:bifunctional DNA primase/polymerase [Actinomadura sp. BRA 177]|uniref:bifunctional DNA primase/polymerase n=1 Tax=Actinomadura sp. BRA 177 TaxID=2745202 RepID=UPI0015953103|nr:bifunctional DNA primase/polymerase [Actinomadura sp. BRA 177]NVI89661.1 bifunctional DNA primase/polymerase [Actinomadura sp. BRA 177]